MTMLRPAILLFILLSLITGGLYPLMTTALGQWWFKDQANGSLIIQNGESRGSRLIGQNFTDPRYFQGRPSATAESPYNPMASGGSNLAGSNPDLDKAVAERVAALRAANAAQKAAPGQHADDLLHVFPGYILPLGDFAHAHRHFAVVLRHIDHDAQSIPTLG